MTYGEYRALMSGLVEQGMTTGLEQTEELASYTKLNHARMERLDKQVKINEELQRLLLTVKEQTWLVLTEAWCGDAAQNLPAIAGMAEASPKVFLHLLLRDQHLELMDKHLTNGGRSIPKLIAYDNDTGDELFTWGPRPAVAQQMLLDHKATPEAQRLPEKEFKTELHKWYAKDRSMTIQQEFLELLK